MTHGIQGRKSSMRFVGSSTQYLSLANQGAGVANLSPNSDDAFSISLWFYADSSSEASLFSNRQSSGEGYWLGVLSQRVYFNWYNSTTDITTFDSAGYTTTYYNGPWSHVVITYDGGGNGTGLKMYINGAFIDSGPSATIGTTTNASDEIRIGRGYRSGNSYYTGCMSNVSFWDKELTPAEIDFIYHGNDGGRGPGDLNYHPSFSNCIGWWLSDNASDDSSTIYDSSQNSYNMTTNNSPTLFKLSP